MTTTEPTATLEAKITAFCAALSDDELSVFAEVLARAAETGDVAGFVHKMPTSVTSDPCSGGEIYDPRTFDMIGNLMVQISTTRGVKIPRPR